MENITKCSKLMTHEAYNEGLAEYERLLKSSTDPFEVMLTMQHDLQNALTEIGVNQTKVDELVSIGHKFDWLRENKQAFDDEYREIVDALPGMNTPEKERSGMWKRWKSNHNEIRAKTFDDLTEEEIVELKFEMCDAFHFFMNFMFAVEVSAKDMFIYYYIKNKENHKRCNNGY